MDQPWPSAARPGKAVPGRGHVELKTLGMRRVALLVRHWLKGSQGCEDQKAKE